MVKKEKSSKVPTKPSAKETEKPTKPKKKSIFSKIIGYFKGSWEELKLVRWPDRKSTWGLTLAVILFSAFFVVLIILLDEGFNLLFKLIIK